MHTCVNDLAAGHADDYSTQTKWMKHIAALGARIWRWRARDVRATQDQRSARALPVSMTQDRYLGWQ
jgi:hypothetical protein